MAKKKTAKEVKRPAMRRTIEKDQPDLGIPSFTHLVKPIRCPACGAKIDMVFRDGKCFDCCCWNEYPQ
jgi:hypothetical protein